MAGSNISSAATTTLFIRETEPVPTGTNGEALALSAACIGLAPTTGNTFAPGCSMVQLDRMSGQSPLFCNIGSAAHPVWGTVTVVAP